MTSTPSTGKCALVVLYNHNYEKNIEKIRLLYSAKFSTVVQIMPFYYGTDSDIIPVHGSSFHFHSFIAQARTKLMEIACDRFLFIGDDLLLNPDINETNVDSKLNLKDQNCYLDGFVNINDGQNNRAVFEAHRFSTTPLGLMGSVNMLIPSYEQAYKTLKEQGKINSTKVTNYKPFLPNWKTPLRSNLYANYKVFKGRVFNILQMIKYKVQPKKVSYPCVFGYSDIVSIHKSRFLEFCRYLEVFASWKMFVELAIPTAVSLMQGHHVITIDQTGYKSGNVWFPQTPEHYKKMHEKIDSLMLSSDNSIQKLEANFPREFLYLHPVKLSRLS